MSQQIDSILQKYVLQVVLKLFGLLVSISLKREVMISKLQSINDANGLENKCLSYKLLRIFINNVLISLY